MYVYVIVVHHHIPEIVPLTTVPFFSSTVTVSFDSFIKNLQHTKEELLFSSWSILVAKKSMRIIPNKLHLVLRTKYSLAGWLLKKTKSLRIKFSQLSRRSASRHQYLQAKYKTTKEISHCLGEVQEMPTRCAGAVNRRVVMGPKKTGKLVGFMPQRAHMLKGERREGGNRNAGENN